MTTATDRTMGLPRDQTRARYPDENGHVERDGVRVFYEVYGDGEPTVLLMPVWTLIHSRHWKCRSRTSPATTGWSRSIREAMDAQTAHPRPRVAERSSHVTPKPCSMPPEPSRPSSSASRSGVSAR